MVEVKAYLFWIAATPPVPGAANVELAPMYMVPLRALVLFTAK